MSKKKVSKRGRASHSSKKATKTKKKPSKPAKAKKKTVKKKTRKTSAKKAPETFTHKLEEGFKHEEELIRLPHTGKYKIPVGVRLLVGYLIFLGVLYAVSFFSAVTSPTSIVFGQVITGSASLVINLIILMSLAVMIWGLLKRKAYTFDLAIVWFGIGLLNSIISFIVFDSSRFAVFGDLLFLSLISLVVINTLIIWYVISEKKYFYSKEFHERPWHHRDRVFVYALVSFWVLVLLIGMSYAVNFYGETTRMVDETIIDFETSSSFFADQVCAEKDGKEKDVCLTVLAAMYNGSDVQRVAELCSDVESDFLRFTCLRTIG